MLSLGSQSSCLYFSNVPESQPADHIQYPRNRGPNGLGHSAAHDGEDEFSFPILRIHLLVVGFQPAQLHSTVIFNTQIVL
jgi:hypothetical protein